MILQPRNSEHGPFAFMARGLVAAFLFIILLACARVEESLPCPRLWRDAFLGLFYGEKEGAGASRYLALRLALLVPSPLARCRPSVVPAWTDNRTPGSSQPGPSCTAPQPKTLRSRTTPQASGPGGAGYASTPAANPSQARPPLNTPTARAGCPSCTQQPKHGTGQNTPGMAPPALCVQRSIWRQFPTPKHLSPHLPSRVTQPSRRFAQAPRANQLPPAPTLQISIAIQHLFITLLISEK